MTEALTAGRMRAIEQAAIGAGTVTGRTLMERAGRGALDAALAEWPELAAGAHRAAVLCGPGNNGGDGFVIARLLLERGWDLRVFLYGDAGRLPPDAAANHAALEGRVPVESWDAAAVQAALRAPTDLVVDALFGTGLARDLPAEIVPLLDAQPARVLAVDIPTGLGSDDGRLYPAALRADLTATFHARKIGHGEGQGPDVCGKVAVVDIGL